MSPNATTRWSRTHEQLLILEQLYGRGLRSPNASQIQRITAHLSLYGKIQGKNVFYWFQNHKARERQKLRKKLAMQLQHNMQLVRPYCYYPTIPHPILYNEKAQTQYTFHCNTPPTSFLDFLATSHLGQIHHPQSIGGACDSERAPQRMMLPKYCSTKSYGHDPMLVADVGPMFLDRTINRSQPETLELFPLRSTSDAKDLEKPE